MKSRSALAADDPVDVHRLHADVGLAGRTQYGLDFLEGQELFALGVEEARYARQELA